MYIYACTCIFITFSKADKMMMLSQCMLHFIVDIGMLCPPGLENRELKCLKIKGNGSFFKSNALFNLERRGPEKGEGSSLIMFIFALIVFLHVFCLCIFIVKIKTLQI